MHAVQLGRLRLRAPVTHWNPQVVESGLGPRSTEGSFHSHTASTKYGAGSVIWVGWSARTAYKKKPPAPGAPGGGVARLWRQSGVGCLVQVHLHLGGYFSDGNGGTCSFLPVITDQQWEKCGLGKDCIARSRHSRCWVDLRPGFTEHLLSVHQALPLY